MEPYLGEIRVFAHGVIPRGWAACNGALLSINQNMGLFSLLGVNYGGDGRNTFALPNLCGSAPVHQGQGYVIGTRSGVENVSITATTTPLHTHLLQVQTANANAALSAAPPAEMLAIPILSTRATDNINAFINTPSGLVPLDPTSLTPAGGSAPHSNMPPFLATNICIAVQGIFPPRN